jgi:hypothetical protein
MEDTPASDHPPLDTVVLLPKIAAYATRPPVDRHTLAQEDLLNRSGLLVVAALEVDDES